MSFLLHLLSVDVHLTTSINDALFTGKLVKSLLIDANQRFKEIFEKSRGPQPKLMHITPLYRDDGGKVKCLYSSAVKSGEGWKVEKVAIGSGVYRFYIGFVESNTQGTVSFDEIYNALLNVGGVHRFSNYTIRADLASVSIVNVATHVRNTVRKLLMDSGKVKLVFSSPTLLRDPLRLSKFKSLVPTPINIFSTPVYILHYLSGKLTARNTGRTLLILYRLLNESYSYLRTATIKWVLYEKSKNPIPTLVGYVNLYLNKAYYEQYRKTYELEGLLENVFTTMLVLGTGTSRASGFGHILLERKD